MGVDSKPMIPLEGVVVDNRLSLLSLTAPSL